MAQHTFGIDLGGTKTEIIVLTREGEEVFRKRVETVKGSYKDTIKTISNLIFDAQDIVKELCPVGIAIPGTVSERTNTIKNANSFWLNGHNLKEDLASVLGYDQIFLENDANCFALSEATDGAGAGHRLVWAIILGTGSGSGIVHNKQVLRGRNLLSGEWGHNPLPWITPEEERSWKNVHCFCHKQNCIESFVSGTGLEREFAKRIGSYSPEDISYSVSSQQIISLMREGHEIAAFCFQNYVSRVARAMAAYINFLDPDVIVLGGGMSNIDELYTLLPGKIREHIFGGEFDTPLLKARFGDSSGVRGAAWLPFMYSRLKR